MWSYLCLFRQAKELLIHIHTYQLNWYDTFLLATINIHYTWHNNIFKHMDGVWEGAVASIVVADVQLYHQNPFID